MVISFSSEKARKYLLENGRVYTFRKNRRKNFIKLEEKMGKIKFDAVRPGMIDWTNEGRTMPKFSDVLIHEVGHFDVDGIEPYVKWSGFSSLNEWQHEIRGLNKYLEPEGWLYMVDLYTRQRSEVKKT